MELSLALKLDSAALFRAPGIIVPPILTPQEIFGPALTHGYQGGNPANISGAGQWIRWTDLGQSPVNLNGANKPLVVVAGINGEDSAQYVPDDQLFFQSATSLGITQPFTIGEIIKPSTSIDHPGQSRFYVTQDGGGAAAVRYRDTTSPVIRISAGTATIDIPAPDADNVIAFIAHFDGVNSFGMVNRDAAVTPGVNIGAGGLGIANFGLSPGADPTVDGNGLTSEIWIPSGAFTPSSPEIVQFMRYLINAAGV